MKFPVALFTELTFAIVLLPWTGALSCGDSAADIGETYTFNISFSLPQRLCFQLNNSTETQAVRVFVESVSAVSRHPVLVTVRQPMGVASWAVPHVESGFSYTSVERTLCPLLNIDDSGESNILVDLSTSYTSPLSVTLRTQFVTPYKLELDEPVDLDASPSAPAYLLFEYPLDITRVKVKFTSTDNTTHICAIASLQTAYCPVVDLLDNPDHRGRYQTMRSTAAINTFENNTEPHFGFFYVVLTVFPNDGRGNSCVSAEQGLGNKLITLDSAANNFDPVSYSGEERVKTVTISIEAELSVGDYVVAMVIPLILYLVFFAIAVVWIIIFEFVCHRNQRIYKYVQRQRQNLAANDKVEAMTELETGMVLASRSQTKDTYMKTDESLCSDAAIDQEPSKEADGQTVTKPPKRPNLLKVLRGTQWSQSLNWDSSTPEDQHPEDNKENGEVTGEGIAREVRPVSPASENTSVSQTEAVNVSRSGQQKNVVNQRRSDCIEKDHMFPANLSMVRDFDESSAMQKEYNHYCVYLFVIIVFYSIPAYQLVITYQRLLTSSGNEDICYYNSLCAHPLEVYTGFSLSTFNNIFSNIGYIILGVLFIYTAYRRKKMYNLFEKHNCSAKLKNEKIGVPQTFGIYYTIGLVMVAQAFMSVGYHMCPTSSNYQFDATFMYVMGILGMYKILKSRSPDLDASLHKIAVYLAIIIFVVVLGGLLLDTVSFKIIFIIVYLITLFVFSVELYYRWQLTLWPSSIKALCLFYKQDGFYPPTHTPRFVIIVISILLNTVIAGGVFLVRTARVDFGKYFVLIIIVNLLLYLFYYSITKCVYREKPSYKAIFYWILALATWIVAIYFFTRDVSNWSVSPALSRDKNADCLVLGFYDSHDMWHFVSAFALFFSFLILMTLDDRQEDKPRCDLKVY